MALSEKSPEDKQKFKSAITGVAILLIIGVFSSSVITEITGVNVESLCKTDPDTKEERCLDNDDAKTMVSEAFFWVGILISGIAFAVLIIAGIKY